MKKQVRRGGPTASTTGIHKSFRFSGTLGEFAEWMVSYGLARSGFDTAHCDEIGIDVIAHSASTGLLGIYVKSRLRVEGTETGSVNLFREAKGHRDRFRRACRRLRCEPWIAVYVEREEDADLFLTSLGHYENKYDRKKRAVSGWFMKKEDVLQYAADPKVMHRHFDFSDSHWFK